MKDVTYIGSAEEFRQHLRELHKMRKNAKLPQTKRIALKKSERYLIHAKTGGKCHVCGQDLSPDKFEADHIKSHVTGGMGIADNFLPACKTCNIYRWHRQPEEIQLVLKLGVWARAAIANNTAVGIAISQRFVADEIKREGRRKQPRIA